MRERQIHVLFIVTLMKKLRIHFKIFLDIFKVFIDLYKIIEKSHHPESNRRPTDYESVALPTELWWRFFSDLYSLISYENRANEANYFLLITRDP